MADFLIKRGTQANYNALGTKSNDTLYVTTDTGNIYLGGKALFEASAFTKATLSGKKVTFTTHGANGTSGTSELDLATFATTAEVSTAISTHKTNVIDPLEARVKAIEDAMGTATLTTDDKTVKGAINEHDSEIGDVDSLSTTNKTLVGAVNEVLAAVGTGGTAAVVTISELGAQGDYVQRYEIKQGNSLVGTINIPKEMVVEDGEVVVDPEGQPAGTYLKLTLQNVTDPIYIDVAKLIDVYTAQQNAAQVQLTINADKEISAVIVAGSINTAELAKNAVTTDKIADLNVTKAKLAQAVQTSLGKADSAYQKPSTGIPSGDIAANAVGRAALDDELVNMIDDATTSDSFTTGDTNGTFKVDGKSIAIKGLDTAAYTKASDYATAAQGEKADSAYQKPTGGIPKTDLVAAVQTSLGKADTALQQQSIEAGDQNGAIKVAGEDVFVTGLDTAAFTKATDYATSAQGTKADSAIQTAQGDSYVSATAANNKITVATTVQALASASSTAKGLAEASDVKAYVDAAAADATIKWGEF